MILKFRLLKGGREYEEKKYSVVGAQPCSAAYRLFGYGMQTLDATDALHDDQHDIDPGYDDNTSYDYATVNDIDSRYNHNINYNLDINYYYNI